MVMHQLDSNELVIYNITKQVPSNVSTNCCIYDFGRQDADQRRHEDAAQGGGGCH